MKLKIEIEVDIKEIFSRIPDGLFTDKSDVETEEDEREYLVEAIGHVFNIGYCTVITNEVDDKINHSDTYPYSKHHYEVEKEIGKQLSHFKIIK